MAETISGWTKKKKYMEDQNLLMHVEHLGNNFYIETSNPPFTLITLL